MGSSTGTTGKKSTTISKNDKMMEKHQKIFGPKRKKQNK